MDKRDKEILENKLRKKSFERKGSSCRWNGIYRKKLNKKLKRYYIFCLYHYQCHQNQIK